METPKLFKLKDIEIIFENNDFIVVNKPSGLLSIADRLGKEQNLKELLLQSHPHIYTVHRIDKGTSGIIIYAKNEATHKFLSQAFENRTIEKYYQGLVLGSPYAKSGTIDAPIREHPLQKGLMEVHQKGKTAVTDFEVMEDYKIFTLINFRIHTGRTHQIRVHAKNMGHPLACDELYGDTKPIFISRLKKNYKLSKNELEEKPIVNRLALHAYQLKFKDTNGNQFEFTAPLHKDMRALLQQLKKK
jgi:23S rRNA pseudouridine1911/1915/1917 synthase